MGTRSPQENRARVQVYSDPYQAMDRSFAIAILTEWDEFKTYDWLRVYQSMHKPAFLFDGRRLVDPSTLRVLGFHLYTLGQ